MSEWYWYTGWLPSLLAVAGNAIVIYLIVTRRRLHTTKNRFVLSLAVADLCVGGCFYPGHAICHLLASSCKYARISDDIAVLAIYSSVCNLCAMALDRFIAIVKPLEYVSLMTAERAAGLTVGAWLIPIFVYFIPSICSTFNLFTINPKVSVIIWTTIFEFIPCTGLLLASTQVVITSRRHHRHDAQLNSQIRFNRPNIKYALKSTSSVKVVTTVVTIFLLCYALEVYSSFCHFTALCTTDENILNGVFLLVILNSAANPFAYALFKRDIKNEFDKLFCAEAVQKTTRNSERTGTSV